jgi:steroid delta-isomerase
MAEEHSGRAQSASFLFASALEEYISYYEGLTQANAVNLINLATEDMHFRDPFNDVRDVRKVVEIMEHMFVNLNDPRFVISDKFFASNSAMLKWEFTFSSKFGSKKSWSIPGVSEVVFSADGKVAEHIDFWDSGTYLFEKMPIVGQLIRFGKRKLRVE